jgi:hypothetical protein
MKAGTTCMEMHCRRRPADAAISNTFGPNTLKSFKVWTDEVNGAGR